MQFEMKADSEQYFYLEKKKKVFIKQVCVVYL